MNTQKILSHFKGVTGGNGQYLALCPAHDDHNPSLSIKIEHGKSPLLNCFAGCKPPDILAAAGWEQNKSEPWQMVGEYSYTPTLKKVRLVKSDGSKKFVWVHRTSTINSKWENGAGGQDYPLYNQSALSVAKQGDTAYVVEGEKDVDTLTKHGRLAVCGPHGAVTGSVKSKWTPAHSDALKGFKVMILPDRDDVGITFAGSVALEVHGVAESVKIIDLAAEWSDLKQGGDITDVFEASGGDAKVFDTLERLAENTAEFVPNIPMDSEDAPARLSKSERLLQLFWETGATVFHDDLKQPYAAVPIGEHTEIWSVEGGDFKLWLNGLYYKETRRTIGSDALKQVVSVLSAGAVFDNPDPIKLSVRAAEHDNAFWYDLSNPKWQAVKATAQGWTVEDKPPKLFKRFKHQMAQVTPQAGGDVRKILEYINIKDNQMLFLCWLISSFVPEIPHAMIVYHGEKGATKSTACSLIKMIIDPSALELLTLKSDLGSLAVNLKEHWFLPFDNVSRISADTSDALCMAITGAGIQNRKLYSDADSYVFKYKRCIAVNGINNVAVRPDLLDRSILIELERVPEAERRELSEVLAAFEADRPEILGGILDTLAKAMAIHPTVKLDKLPRMADFARWGYAIAQALGGHGETFLAEYAANGKIQNSEAIASDPVAILMIEFMRNRKNWDGRISDLFTELIKIAPKHGINPRVKGFPTLPTTLSRKLGGIKSNLEAAGIEFEKHSDMRGTNILITNAEIAPLAPYKG